MPSKNAFSYFYPFNLYFCVKASLPRCNKAKGKRQRVFIETLCKSCLQRTSRARTLLYNQRFACVCNKILQTTKRNALKVAKKAFFPCTSPHCSVWIFANLRFITPAKVQIISKLCKPFIQKALFLRVLVTIYTHCTIKKGKIATLHEKKIIE